MIAGLARRRGAGSRCRGPNGPTSEITQGRHLLERWLRALSARMNDLYRMAAFRGFTCTQRARSGGTRTSPCCAVERSPVDPGCGRKTSLPLDVYDSTATYADQSSPDRASAQIGTARPTQDGERGWTAQPKGPNRILVAMIQPQFASQSTGSAVRCVLLFGSNGSRVSQKRMMVKLIDQFRYGLQSL
jgi:hypothetical protein